MPRDAWLDASGQRWKLRLGTGVGTVLSVAGVWLFLTGDWPAMFHGALLAIGALVPIFGLAWAIRCDVCGHRPVIQAMTDQPVGKWAGHVFSLRACPSCGYDGRPRCEGRLTAEQEAWWDAEQKERVRDRARVRRGLAIAAAAAAFLLLSWVLLRR